MSNFRIGDRIRRRWDEDAPILVILKIFGDGTLHVRRPNGQRKRITRPECFEVVNGREGLWS